MTTPRSLNEHTAQRWAMAVAPVRSAESKWTEVANAKRFAEQHHHAVRFCQGMGWLSWTGQRWEVDSLGRAQEAAKDTVKRLAFEAAGVEDSNDRREAMKFATKSASEPGIRHLLALARTDPALAVAANLLDADPWLLNVSNGVVDLRTGALRPHAPEDLMTKLAPVMYDPASICLRFDAFLSRIFEGDGGEIEYVQHLLGCCLTGDIREQIFPVFVGTGGNGKSVLLDTVTGIMGDYAGLAPPTLLTDTGRSEHPTEYADLMGRRLVLASETEQGARLKVQALKRLTGDAKVKARWMRGDFFEFTRTHKTIMVTNNKPRIGEDTEGVWRRVRVVPFDVTIPVGERDPELLDKLREEWPGILAWMIRGCADWQREGLGKPMAVMRATERYREEENHVGRFIVECLQTTKANPDAPDLFAPWAQLWKTYGGWCGDTGEEELPAPDLRDALDRLGYPSVQRRPYPGAKPVRGRLGIEVRS